MEACFLRLTDVACVSLLPIDVSTLLTTPVAYSSHSRWIRVVSKTPDSMHTMYTSYRRSAAAGPLEWRRHHLDTLVNLSHLSHLSLRTALLEMSESPPHT